MSSLLERMNRGGQGLLSLLEGIDSVFAPSRDAPLSDPGAEALAGPAGATLARQQYGRNYNAARAQAVRSGARWYEMDALAGGEAQKQFGADLVRAAQVAEALRSQRAQSGRTDALQKLIAGITDPKQRAALETATPEDASKALLKEAFPGENSRYQLQVLGNGQAVILDTVSGEERMVGEYRDPVSAMRPIAKAEGADLVYRHPQTLEELMRIPNGASRQYKPTDTQLLSHGFASRMVEADKGIARLDYVPTTADLQIFDKIIDENTNATIRAELNGLLSPKAQQYFQYVQDFNRAKLRRESGAVITKEEIIGDLVTFFPMPGDDPQTRRQKARARAIATNALIQSAGSQWKDGEYPIPGLEAPPPEDPNAPRVPRLHGTP